MHCLSQSPSVEKINPKKDFERVYGINPTLYNGLLYSTFYPGKVKGDQFFINSNYIKGEATIRGVKYYDLELNYDLYKQVLILKYINSSNMNNVIEISKAWLENFTLGKYQFRYYGDNSNPKRFYQVLGSGSMMIFYHWEKKLESENDYIGYTYYHFKTLKESYVFIDNTLKLYKNNKSFVQIFSKEKQSLIKDYLKQNKINVKTSSDQTMNELINYCSKLY